MAHGLYVRPIFSSVKPLDGDIKQVEVVDATPDGGMPFAGPVATPLSSGRHVRTENLPTRMHWGSRGGASIPDFDNGLILNVSERARDVIETVEPDVHQFVPVEYESTSGKPLDRRYFLIVGNRIDGVSRQSPGMILFRDIMWRPARDLPEDQRPPGYSDEIKAELAFDAAAIGGVHLWVDKHISSVAVYLSDLLAQAIREAGLTGVELPQVKVF